MGVLTPPIPPVALIRLYSYSRPCSKGVAYTYFYTLLFRRLARVSIATEGISPAVLLYDFTYSATAPLKEHLRQAQGMYNLYPPFRMRRTHGEGQHANLRGKVSSPENQSLRCPWRRWRELPVIFRRGELEFYFLDYPTIASMEISVRRTTRQGRPLAGHIPRTFGFVVIPHLVALLSETD